MIFLSILLFNHCTQLIARPTVIALNSLTFQIIPNQTSQGFILTRKNGILQITDFNNLTYQNFDTQVENPSINTKSYQITNIASNASITTNLFKLDQTALKLTNTLTLKSNNPNSLITSITIQKLPQKTYATILGHINFLNPNMFRPSGSIQTAEFISGAIFIGCSLIIKLNNNLTNSVTPFSSIVATDGNFFLKRMNDGKISWNDLIICSQALIIGDQVLASDDLDDEFISKAELLNPRFTFTYE